MSSPDSAEPSLLHSLSTFWEQIAAALELVRPARIVEIGSEGGSTTARLLEWAGAHDAQLVSIDPDPAAVTRRLAEGDEHLTLVSGASPWVLQELEPADLYVIDGDHNYWTVFAELEAVFGEDRGPLAILHDIGWPSGRRDMYYAPERLPAGAVHPYSQHGGAVPGKTELVEGGFRGRGAFAWAQREGGERNGVLTAVEDWMKVRGDLSLISLPCIFGVGFLYPTKASWANKLKRRLGPLDELALLSALERNRLRLYLELIDAQDTLEQERERMYATLNGMRSQLDALAAENQALKVATPGDAAA